MFGQGHVIVLAERSLQDLSIDVNKLSCTSHKKIYVKCQRCSEEFLRERRLLHQRHSCPVFVTCADGQTNKWCNKCKMYLSTSLFSPNPARACGYQSFCLVCNSLPSTFKLKQNRATVEGRMKWMYTRKQSECLKSNVVFDLTIDFLISQWNKQKGRCFYSNLKLRLGSNPRSVSIVRRDPSIGYITTNVVLVSKAMDWAKSNTTEEDFLSLLDEINHDMIGPRLRLECKKLHPDADLPFRARTTDAGYDVSSIESVIIPPHGAIKVSTGIALSAPSGYYYTIEGRSSLWTKGIIPFRGIVDGTYTGPLIVVLMNTTNEPYKIGVHDRIAQIILHRILHCDVAVVEEFSPEYNQRGVAGFGSTGR